MTDDNERVTEGGEPLDAVTRAALIPDAVRAGTRARLVARAKADAEARGLSPNPSRALSLPFRANNRVVGAGMALALAASLVLLVNRELMLRSERTNFLEQTNGLTRALDSLGAALANRDKLLASLTGAEVKVMHLASAQTAAPRALMFWNQATNGWTFVAHNLAPLKPGRTYQLWLVTASAKISAGTFSVTADGDAVVQATYPLDKRALMAVAVTEEPTGGVEQPTGAMVVVGTAPAN